MVGSLLLEYRRGKGLQGETDATSGIVRSRMSVLQCHRWLWGVEVISTPGRDMMSVFGFERITVLKVVLVAALLAACFLALAETPHPAVASFPGANGKIAFASDRDGNYEIYTMDADSSGQTRLTNNAAFDDQPAWSPNGTKIAFVTNRDVNMSEIYVMNADGSNQTRLTNNTAADFAAAFSPDGTKIVFTTERDHVGGQGEIYVMNTDGSNQTRLTNALASESSQEPQFSPDGTKIAFVTNRDVNYEIYTMNTDGSNQTRLTNNTAIDFAVDFSPDGTKIAFTTNRDGNLEIYTMNVDGSGQTRLTNNAATESDPKWPPDGTKIAFVTSRDGNDEIYTMNADGSGQMRLTDNATAEAFPSWQPITYNFSGFYQPVDNLPTLNKSKPGKSIPIRFSLGGDKGLNIFATGYPKSEAIACDSTATVDGIEETVPGKGDLSYNASTGRYEYDWGTSGFPSGCRQFVMKLRDGSIQRANFIFR